MSAYNKIFSCLLFLVKYIFLNYLKDKIFIKVIFSTLSTLKKKKKISIFASSNLLIWYITEKL